MSTSLRKWASGAALGVAMGGLAAGGVASASTLLESQTVSVTGPGALIFSQYSGTGTLREVDISAGQDLLVYSVVSNISPSTIVAQFDAGCVGGAGCGIIADAGAPAALLALHSPAGTNTFNLFAPGPFDSATYTFTPGAFKLVDLLGVSLGSVAFTTPTDLAGFAGAGQFSLSPAVPAYINTHYLVNPVSGYNPLTSDWSLSYDSTMTVSYYGDPYTPPPPAPEPGAWALMLTGLGLASASLRRRRACNERGTPV